MLPDDDSNPEHDAELNEILANLRSEYRGELPHRLEEMRGYLNQARSADAKQLEWLEKAHTIAHRLAGTAGSYGFDSLSQAAANLDLYLKNLMKSEAGAAAAAKSLNWHELDGLAEAMDKSIP